MRRMCRRILARAPRRRRPKFRQCKPSRPTIVSVHLRGNGATCLVPETFHSLVDVVRGASQPLRGRVSTNMNVRDPRSPTVLAMSTAPCASRPGDLLFTRRRRQRHLAPCPPSDARTVHEASVTAAARLPGVTGGRIDEASRARRRRGHHVECPRTPQTSLGPGSASALRSAKVASWQSRRRRRLVPADRRSRPTGCDSRRWQGVTADQMCGSLRCCT